MNPTVTLDTNCIIDLQKGKPAESRRAMERLIDLVQQNQLDIAVTTRVDFESTHQPTIDVYKKLIESGKLKVIASTTRLGVSKLGTDVFPNESQWKSIAIAVFPNCDPESLFRPQGRPGKKYLDVDHLYGHLVSQRDFFLTRDTKDIINARDRLAPLSIHVCTPQEFITTNLER